MTEVESVIAVDDTMTPPVTEHDTRDPRALKPHPLNATLYGEEYDAALKASIEANGRIHTPLIITRDGTIISGHHRREQRTTRLERSAA